MLLSELLRAIGESPLRARGPLDLDPALSEVLLDDGVTAIGPGQIVLAVRPGAEQDLVDRAAQAECQAVVVPSASAVKVPAAVVVLDSDVAWTQLFVLLRTMLLGSHDEASEGGEPTSVHGLADAVAVMVGGSVVLYDRAHRVLAYSVQGHDIDQVRRDAILGRRTPDQWVRRFTVDRTAYQTYAEPGRVVRVADYKGLHTRLRVAVHTGNEVIGEISVAEGGTPFPPHAEEALQRAARLAVPVMLRHRRAQDVERTSRERTVRALLREGTLPPSTHPGDLPSVARELFVVGFALERASEEPGALPDGLASERFVHFLSLHLSTIDPASLVAALGGVYWAIVPAGKATGDWLVKNAGVALSQLARMGVRANAAIGPLAAAPDLVPSTKRTVEDLLAVAQSSGVTGQVLTPESNWAQLVLVAACRELREGAAVPRGPIDALIEHDKRHEADLLATLEIFLDSFGSVSAAAARLFLHPNTLRHRLQRIAEVSGLDLEDADQRLAAAILLRSAAVGEARTDEGS